MINTRFRSTLSYLSKMPNAFGAVRNSHHCPSRSHERSRTSQKKSTGRAAVPMMPIKVDLPESRSADVTKRIGE